MGNIIANSLIAPQVPKACEVLTGKDYGVCRHRRYYQIAGITIQLQSDIPISDQTFELELKKFEVAEPGSDIISISLHFLLPDLQGIDLGKEVYRRPPWVIYHQDRSWIYLGIAPKQNDIRSQFLAVFNDDHTYAAIYANRKDQFLKGQGSAHLRCFQPIKYFWLTFLPLECMYLPLSSDYNE